LKNNFPALRYLKLTGNTKIGQRFQIAQTFNGDSDIRVLLVTTAVGGEGLNLSSANVVIMFDHDYNPTVDMQAIDRAHRIGQKRVLNVYRLITKDTLEERIMGIQKFKTNLANAIVNIDNSSIKNIKESNLPELLENIRDIQTSNKEAETSINKSIYKQMIDELEKNAIDSNDFKKTY
jgi:TATA-binding protein-associated factor